MTFSEMSVLHVEDEVLIAMEVSHVLASLGFKQVELAHTLKSAEDIISKQRFDAAILDVNLGNGERTLSIGRKLRQMGTQVVFASVYNRSELSEDYQSFEFLEKPISVLDLTNVLQKLRARAEN